MHQWLHTWCSPPIQARIYAFSSETLQNYIQALACTPYVETSRKKVPNKTVRGDRLNTSMQRSSNKRPPQPIISAAVCGENCR